MKYTEEQFKADVIAECKAIKEHATAEELSRLSEGICGYSDHTCVYGLMTHDCKSERAVELIGQCCTAAFEFKSLSGFNNIVGQLDSMNHVTVDLCKVRLTESIVALTALEVYVFCRDVNPASIQSYLTGATETLSL